MDLGNVASLAYSWPELILGGGALLVLALELTLSSKRWIGEVALVVVAAAIAAAGMQVGGSGTWLFGRMVALDPFAIFFKILLGLAAGGTIWMASQSRELEGEHPGEFYFLLLCATLGTFYMASAANLLMAYLALEFVSQTSYILAGFLRRRPRSAEAALKYLVYGGVASGAMIYGMSLLYGLAGSLDYSVMAERMGAIASGGPVAVAAVVLVLVGLGYKISMAPFHQWSPDVYEGAPLPITAFLAVGSKAAGFAMLIRLFYTGLAHGEAGGFVALAGIGWPALLAAAAMVTMTVGNLTALRQDNVKRLLAYSSIAHAGYMLMALSAMSGSGLRAVLFYLVVYYFMNLGAFAVLLMVLNVSGREDLVGFRGLAWRGGALPAAAMLIFLFSLAGLPPFAGFIGKMYLFAAVIEQHMWTLALVAAVNSVVAIYYYAKIARVMYLEDPEPGDPVMTVDGYTAALVGFLVLGTVTFGIYWAPVVGIADRATALLGH